MHGRVGMRPTPQGTSSIQAELSSGKGGAAGLAFRCCGIRTCGDGMVYAPWMATRQRGDVNDLATMLVCSLGLVACAGSYSPVHQVTTYLPARDVEQRLEQAFASLGLPVVEHARDGRVRTGRFDPVAVWGGRTSGYVRCGRGGEDDLRA